MQAEQRAMPYHERLLVEHRLNGIWCISGGRQVDSWRPLVGDQRAIRAALVDLGRKHDGRVRRVSIEDYDTISREMGWDDPPDKNVA